MTNLQDKIKEYIEKFPNLILEKKTGEDSYTLRYVSDKVEQFWIDYIRTEMEGLIPKEKSINEDDIMPNYSGGFDEGSVKGYNRAIRELKDKVYNLLK